MVSGHIKKKTNKGGGDPVILKYKLEWKSRNLTGKKWVETVWVRI